MSTEYLTVRADLLSQLPDVAPLVVRACQVACDRQGLAVGDWLRLLSDTELDEAMVAISQARADEHVLMQWTLFAVLLATGEGMLVPVKSNLTLLLRKVYLLLQLEMAHREGLVDLEHGHLRLETFDPTLVKAVRPRHSPAGAPVPATFGIRVVQVPMPAERKS